MTDTVDSTELHTFETHPLIALTNLVRDFDRCEHGRHEGDRCFSCPGQTSTGNPHMQPGQVVAYDRGGEPLCMPGRADKLDPAAWRRKPARPSERPSDRPVDIPDDLPDDGGSDGGSDG